MNTGPLGAGLILMTVLGIEAQAVFGQAKAQSAAVRIDEGKKIYAKHCAGCHGREGKGDGYKLLGADPANLASPAVKKKSDVALLDIIHEGKPNMPSWKARLSEQESRDVLAYIRTLSR